MSKPDEKLRILLDARKDGNNKTYHLGKLKFPGSLDCTDGIIFMIFTSEEGNEELQIGPMEPREVRQAYKKRFGEGER